VADLTHDTAEDGFHEIQLSGKQLVFLFMATTVASVVIFLCGVLVGRGVAAEAGTATSIAETEPEDMPAEAAVPPAEPPTPVDDELRYQERLTANGPTKEEPKPEPPAAATASAASQAAAPPPPETRAAPQEPPAPDVPTSGRSGTWFIQVSALGKRGAAAEMVRDLAAKGYPAYLQEPGRGEAVLYRVRVGRFRDRGEAEKVAARLKEHQFASQIRRN
jgi:DedD protein